MGVVIEQVEFLLLVAAVVAIIARRLHMPYTVGLVLAGTMLSFFPALSGLILTKDIIFKIFLPPLIFEAAFQMDWRSLARQLPITFSLATLGLLLAATVTALGIHFILGWEWHSAMLLSILISATDPVSVIAAFKEYGIRGRLQMLVESESLLNDGTAAVLFAVALTVIAGGPIALPHLFLSFLSIFFGGVLGGAILGWAAGWLAGKSDDPLVEITVTALAAYGSFLGAEHFHVSGVMATLTAGIVLGNAGTNCSITGQGRELIIAFWEYIAFVANSIIFLLIGLQLSREHISDIWIPSLVVIGLVLLGRAVAVYGSCLPFSRSALRVPTPYQHILFWGGLRGALALALVFSLPNDFPNRAVISTVTFSVVAFSVLVQGLTMPLLLRKFNFI
jgi:monovalent cation:H+ antiporter, CPA1 family